MLDTAKWISCGKQGVECPTFSYSFKNDRNIKSAVLTITSAGVYEAKLNGKRVGDFYMAPGWTDYKFRLQVQSYDITDMLCGDNSISVVVGTGWWNCLGIARARCPELPVMLLAEIELTYADRRTVVIGTDSSWKTTDSAIRYADMYNGETYDANFEDHTELPTVEMDFPKHQLIPQQGEKIIFHERLKPAAVFTTPKGERVIDFGQEITGIIELKLNAKKGDVVAMDCAEMLDKDGNVYNENYRSAKCTITYICADGEQTWHPALTFYGFRYLRLLDNSIDITADNITAIAVYSDIKQTGRLNCGVPKLNRLFDNIFWSQKDNFLDVPTDCPQRDERLGWTGDAEVFVKTACYNFDVKRFFTKWLDDMMVDQRENGGIPHTVPDVLNKIEDQIIGTSCAWADAATICPWEIYLHYGDKELLRHHFPMMKKWVDCVRKITKTPNIWTGSFHFGDWLSMDENTNKDLLATAYHAYSTELVCKAGKVLGEDVSEYEALYARIVENFRSTFPVYNTQAECVVALRFGLAADPKAVAEKLVELVHERDDTLSTGFPTTHYLLYALSENGYTDLAYTLLLQEKFPSWLFSVNQGATTIWEHWDGFKEDGTFWSASMNSFNHYSFGSVAEWVYEVAAGIQRVEAAPAFEEIRIHPHPDRRLGWLDVTEKTAKGDIRVKWSYNDTDIKNTASEVRYEITVPCKAELVLDGKTICVEAGTWMF